MDNKNILKITDLNIQFQHKGKSNYAVNGISFNVKEGEILGIVGESGCGKSVSLFSILKLLPIQAKVSGSVIYKDKNILELSEKDMQNIRGKEISMIFQEPMSSLNPVLTIQEQLVETIVLHDRMKRKEARERAVELLKMVEIPDAEKRLKAYPHQLSGGMRQRVMIAMALSCHPQILLADEPTTALDVTIQMQIMSLLKRLRKETNMSIVIVSHDLNAIAEIADRVLVFYSGSIVEEAEVNELLLHPIHPYTQGLLKCIPSITSSNKRLNVIEGMVPDINQKQTSCPFSSRCIHARTKCFESSPAFVETSPNHHVACHFYDCLLET